MLKHIVMWTIREDVNGKSKEEIALEAVERLNALKDKIPQIKYLRAGINAADASPANFDISLEIEFENMRDLDIYAVHPAHQEFKNFFEGKRIERVAIDYYYY